MPDTGDAQRRSMSTVQLSSHAVYIVCTQTKLGLGEERDEAKSQLPMTHVHDEVGLLANGPARVHHGARILQQHRPHVLAGVRDDGRQQLGADLHTQ
jgi:hypothetical protein